MRRGLVASVFAGLIVVGSAMGSEGRAQASPTLTCDVTSIPARSASVETTCTVENFPPNTDVTFLAAPITATTDASGTASATFRIPCCFPEPGEFSITASAEDGTTASTTVTVVAAAPEPVAGQPALTG